MASALECEVMPNKRAAGRASKYMNVPNIKRSTSQRACLSSAKVLKFNGDIAIQSCTNVETTGESLLVKDNLLLFVIDGIFQIKYGTVTYTVEKNHMALLKKDILIECKSGSQLDYHDGTKFILIYFKYDLLKEFVKLAQLSVLPPKGSSVVTIDALDARLLKFIDSLESYFIEPDSIDEYLTKIKLLELLFNLVQVERNIVPQLMDLRPHFRADITTTVEDNLMTPMSLSQLAVLSGRSLSSFKRDFLAIYNMPPSTWLRQRRLEKARDLLLKTTMTVTDVCYSLGFENLAHFSRLFKFHFGYSPSKSRTAILQVS
jgi:AraC family transcriptional regulator, exoenzyme S synthesis regulatory protein ExsA